MSPDSRTGQTELSNHWRSVPSELILENRLKVRLSETASNNTAIESIRKQTERPGHSVDKDYPSIVRSIRSLLMEVENMHGILKKIYTLVIALSIINLVVIVILLRA